MSAIAQKMGLWLQPAAIGAAGESRIRGSLECAREPAKGNGVHYAKGSATWFAGSGRSWATGKVMKISAAEALTRRSNLQLQQSNEYD